MIFTFSIFTLIYLRTLAQQYDGRSTFYDLYENAPVSCPGIKILSADIDTSAAVSASMYDSPRHGLCGKCALVFGPDGQSIRVRIVDRCEGCAATSLDLSRQGFQKIADLNAGKIAITWSIVDCRGSSDAVVATTSSDASAQKKDDKAKDTKDKPTDKKPTVQEKDAKKPDQKSTENNSTATDKNNNSSASPSPTPTPTNESSEDSDDNSASDSDQPASPSLRGENLSQAVLRASNDASGHFQTYAITFCSTSLLFLHAFIL